MITGDKGETAKMIATSCGLFDRPDLAKSRQFFIDSVEIGQVHN